jgi:hypothetical protein
VDSFCNFIYRFPEAACAPFAISPFNSDTVSQVARVFPRSGVLLLEPSAWMISSTSTAAGSGPTFGKSEPVGSFLPIIAESRHISKLRPTGMVELQ